MPALDILIFLSNETDGQFLVQHLSKNEEWQVRLAGNLNDFKREVESKSPDLAILEDVLPGCDGFNLATSLLENDPGVFLCLYTRAAVPQTLPRILQAGFRNCISPATTPRELVQIAEQCREHRQNLTAWLQKETQRGTQPLHKQVQSLELLQKVGHKITASLELDTVLTAVVGAAVELTGAEEGSLLLRDETSGDLYMRAALNFREDFVRTFRLPVEDTLLGEVVRRAEPVLINEKTPVKITTAYLVRSLMYVPIILYDHTIGVLGVDNRESDRPFSKKDLAMASALADYAAIAIENARLYSISEIERNKLETILTKVEDGVIVLDHEKRILLINQVARRAFGLFDVDPSGEPIEKVIHNQDLLELLGVENEKPVQRCEVKLDDGRVFNVQATPITEVGLTLTMQDITQLKELDRIKTEFVSTVSHDLRSPLTAILGYVELMDRVGPLNAQQKEFVRRVQFSIQNITSLINDLLDLGRIEAGFDSRKEIVPIAMIVHYAAEGLLSASAARQQLLAVDAPDTLPYVLGNPVRLRQMLANLISNAIKYTPVGGHINVRGSEDSGQIILQIEDDGPGIPSQDQPYIFDKFFRATNLVGDTSGTGLGLAIVKSIVEDHRGRIWVDSQLGKGSTFTVVLPATRQLGEDLGSSPAGNSFAPGA